MSIGLLPAGFAPRAKRTAGLSIPANRGRCWTSRSSPRPGKSSRLDSGLGPLCGLLDDGSITCWNFDAELVAIPGPFEQFSIGAGTVSELGGHGRSEENTHTCAIHDDGSIECWGTNGSGQTELPPPWLDAPPYSDIAAGFAHTCALGATGEAVCWGDDRHGQTRAPTGNLHRAQRRPVAHLRPPP